MKKIVFAITVLIAAAAVSFSAGESETSQSNSDSISGHVMLYSSMKDSQLAALKDAFNAKYPDIQMDYYSAGTGKVMTKLSAEEMAGTIEADVIWVGEPTNYYSLMEKDLLLPYVSPEAVNIPDALKAEGDYFIGARIITLGLVYNTQLVTGGDIPGDWDDLLLPRFKDLIVMTDPTFSGTTLYTLVALVQNPDYGWDFIRQLKENGMRLEQGSSAVVNKVGAGEYDVCIGVDYIARSKMAEGSPIDFVYTDSGISTVMSPIAIMKTTENLEAAKLLYDYILSTDGQKILMDVNVIPVRPDLLLETGISVEEAVEKALPVDEMYLLENKDEILQEFDKIMKTE
jgi:iron(III) transport system substrate-binding protein